MKQRIILHIDMDCFFAAVEERENPRFQGKPVVVGADPKEGKGRGVVSTANYSARKYGIHSAMPISQAYKLCPQAVFLPVDGKLYSEVSEKIMEIIQATCPGCPIEQLSLDEAYIDISDLAKNYNTIQYWSFARTFAEKLQGEILVKEHLPCSIGIGPNKMVAKIACEKAKPSSVRHSMFNISKGIFMVKPQEVQKFLDPLPIRNIPGVGPKTALALASLVRLRSNSLTEPRRTKEHVTVKDARRIPLVQLREHLGKHGEVLYERLQGIDETPVVVKEEVKSLGKEHTFEKDTRDGEVIFTVFRKLVKDVATELKRENYLFQTITVVCRFQGFETHTKSKTFKSASQDPGFFEKQAMQLLLKFLVENPKPVRLVGIRAKVAQENAE